MILYVPHVLTTYFTQTLTDTLNTYLHNCPILLTVVKSWKTIILEFGLIIICLEAQHATILAFLMKRPEVTEEYFHWLLQQFHHHLAAPISNIELLSSRTAMEHFIKSILTRKGSFNGTRIKSVTGADSNRHTISQYENTIGIKSNCQYCQSSLETKNAMYVGGA